MKHKHLKQSKLARGVALSLLVGGASNAIAGYQGQQPGPTLTLGKASLPTTILAAHNNPAAGEHVISDDDGFRMGYLSSIGASIEIGEVDNFLDDVDELQDALNNENLNFGDALDIKQKFDALLPKFGEDARVTVGLGVNAPFFPMALRTEALGGVLGFNIHGAALFDVSFLDDPLDILITTNGVELNTASSLYIKGATLVTGSLAYSRELWEPEILGSKLYGGVQVNAYSAKLNKQVLALSNMAEDEDASEVIEDEFSENTVSSTDIGVDLGLLWDFPNGHAGFTITNVNEPEFEYGSVGVDCASIADTTRQANCLVARNVFANEIALEETAVMTAQTTVEGAIYTEDKQFLIAGAYDLNSTYDLVGRESQIISGSISYFPNSYIIPTIRLGYSQNLVGSELSTVGFGTTLFGMMNIDIAASMDSVEYDGSEYPRRIAFNIGFEEKF